MQIAIHAAAIALTAMLCLGVLDGMTPARPSRWAWRAAAWCFVIGGGVYGLGCYDSGLLPGFNWLSLIAIVSGGFVMCLVAAYRKAS